MPKMRHVIIKLMNTTITRSTAREPPQASQVANRQNLAISTLATITSTTTPGSRCIECATAEIMPSITIGDSKAATMAGRSRNRQSKLGTL